MTHSSAVSLIYCHRQLGRDVLLLMTGALTVAVATAVATGSRSAPLPALLLLPVLVLVAILFASLTITVDSTHVAWAFSFGLLGGQVDISSITTARIVDLHWWEGWGIRVTAGGRLMRVTGKRAVEITTSRDRVRLGSDEPSALLAAIERARGSR